MRMRDELIVVTGGAGFIGSHTVGRLLEGGARVVVLDNFCTGYRENLADFAAHEGSSLFIYEADMNEELWQVFAAIRQDHGPVDRIIHLAAQTSVIVSINKPIRDLHSNYLATVQLLEYARIHKVKKVVMASSAAVYGDLNAEQVHEELPTKPLSPYGIHKLSSELQMAYYQRVHGLPTGALRFFNVYGPKQDPDSPYSGVVSIFAQRALRGEPIVIFGDGSQTRDFLYVGDVARALVTCTMQEDERFGVFNIGTGKPTTIRAIAEEIVALCGGSCEIHYQPARIGEIQHSCADVSKAREVLGFSTKTSLRDGLAQTISWLRQGRPSAVT